MSRPSRRPTPRRTAALVAGAVLGASSLVGASTAQATPGVVDNQATILRIGGSAVTGSNPIPSGRTLTPVVLTTSDPETSAGDGTLLNGAVAGFRIGGTRVPGTPAEQVTFRINGTTVATSVPAMRGTSLQTDAGSIPAVVFTAGGATYAMTRTAPGNATRTVAQSTVNTVTVNVLSTFEYGLVPVGSQPRAGSAFVQSTFDGTTISTRTERYTVLDADAVRRNAGAIGEELIFLGEPRPRYSNLLGFGGTDVLATVNLRSGATVTVRGVQFDVFGTYGESASTYLLDRSALAASGATITDVTRVVSSTPSAHALTWTDLGFGPA
jgi:hypothetical protein